MPVPLPPEIQVVELADGVRYVLPRRKLGPARFIGCAPMLFGLPFLAAGLFVISMGAWKLVTGGGTEPPALKIFLMLFGVPFALVGLFIVGAGFILIQGHTEIEISGGFLRVTERAGLIRWTALRKIENLSRISVFNAFLGDLGTANPRLRPAGGIRTATTNKARAIIAESQSKPLLKIAGGYPREWLEPLADDLTRRINDLRLLTPGASPVELADIPQALLDAPAPTETESSPEPAPREPLQQPAGSRCTFEPRPNGLTITVPALGMRSHIIALFIMGLIFSAMPVFMFIVVGVTSGPFIWFIVPFLSIFLAIGIGLTLTALNLATRRAIIDAVAGTLLVTQAGLFGRKQREWPAADLAAIYRGPSSMKVNNRPVLQITIEPRDGDAIGVMAGTNEDDLAWIADALQRTLKVDASRTDNPAA